jgi:hypothetical protein
VAFSSSLRIEESPLVDEGTLNPLASPEKPTAAAELIDSKAAQLAGASATGGLVFGTRRGARVRIFQFPACR